MTWYLIAGLVLLAIGIWLKRQQARFVAGLRAKGDPLAEHQGTKAFRQKFQTWLFGLDGKGPAPVRSLITLLMVGVLSVLVAWSLIPALFE